MIRTLTLAGLIALLPATSFAAPITSADGWQTFYFGDTGSSWLDAPAFDDTALPSHFELTLDHAALLQVTDGGFAGDRFDVQVNGKHLGFTSTVAAGTDDLGLDFDAAYASTTHSHGSWLLAAGSYTITGTAADSAFGAGIGALRVAEVPEPSSLAMLLGGLGLLGATRFARKR
ncbi:hypothetical protein GCM10025771_07240 [Niveibacterium umoris]|uniref:Ice-binding protein C-terminal domain-containing protein n=1 Tax=Niveibacterium umoris TaxID=1193620 RepID=A0A840BQI4_9RHOO|nr:PEP-CTERM sorting domain-containing protein [Niveibacterium umoris]MBB4013729.1 hypothetical protein [Niveibacterium umoris]